MSSVSSISSGVNSPQTSNSSVLATLKNDLNSLQTSLQSGNVSAAKTAFAAVQKDFQNLPQPPAGSTNSTSTSSNSTIGSTIQTDLQVIGSALQSGNISGAQKAFSNLQTNLLSAKGHHGGHRHGGKGLSGIEASSSDVSQTTGSSSSTRSTSSTTTQANSSLNAVPASDGSSSTNDLVANQVNVLG